MFISRMRVRFVRRQETGSQHYGFSAERQGGDHSARIRDTTSYGDGKWCYRIHNSRCQRHCGDLTLDMTTSLRPLCDYDIHAAGCGALGRFHRTNLEDDLLPAACTRSTYGVAFPQKNEMTGTCSSKHTAKFSSCGRARMKFTPKGSCPKLISMVLQKAYTDAT